MSIPTLASEYSDTAALATRIETHEKYSEHPGDIIRAVIDALGLRGSEDLADIGCGDARFLARLSGSGHSGCLVGVDNSPTMVAVAEGVAGVKGVLADATLMPFGDNKFDVVTARHMLYHLIDPVAALSEFRRITAPSGSVAVTVNHANACGRTHGLVADHARRHGIRPPVGMINAVVNSDTIADMMTGVFGNVALTRHDDALLFTEPASLLRFAASLFSFYGIPTDQPVRAAIRADLSAAIDEWFASNDGDGWRDPKGYSVAVSVA
ncbi:SAM-dependent methyltransferase [Nocardia transvalensis]|uniref:SAM-dependent methyltransferase n=1 Tax=Nocardia transvalensis TaxID=37333 RepID=A0A7W9PG50_9NOCA|nr:class I SAM-dependent methyltransferase [Nocardia transvalensis]MBB5915517.1 SAM-dependent methyltransferase [Nocardia transvalensis]